MTDDDDDMPLVPFDAKGLTASGDLSAGELKVTVAICGFSLSNACLALLLSFGHTCLVYSGGPNVVVVSKL